MKSTSIILAALMAAAGCNRVAKVDNPVAPEPPPRISLNDAAPDEATPLKPAADTPGQFMVRDEKEPVGANQGIPAYEELSLNTDSDSFRQTAATATSESLKEDLGNATGTVALVNGSPIFVEDVLQEFSIKLRDAEQHLQPEEIRKLRAKILRARLPVHIESKLLSNALLKSLKKEQQDALEAGLEEHFLENLEKKKQQLGITNQGQLEVMLAKEGITMQRMRQAFREHEMAKLYVLQNAGAAPKYSRQELLDRYYENQEDFAVAGKVKWMQIVLRYEQQKGEIPATRLMETVKQKLIEGADFAELAKEYSDGATASEGGLWDWTEMGALADENLEAILFQLPRGTVSDVIRNEHGLQIVKVIERVDPGYLPFADVHEKIAASIRDEQYQVTAKKLIDSLKQGMVLESKYDLGPEAINRAQDPYAMQSQVDVQ